MTHNTINFLIFSVFDAANVANLSQEYAAIFEKVVNAFAVL